jgi:hypothetical protein
VSRPPSDEQTVPDDDDQSPPDEPPQSGALAPRESSLPDVEPRDRPQGMLPGRERGRGVVEQGFVRVIATGGIVGVATVLGAVLVSQEVAGWIVGLVVGATSVVLAAVLWSSRQL